MSNSRRGRVWTALMLGAMCVGSPAWSRAAGLLSPVLYADDAPAKVDLNNASDKDLENLPGVGASTARKIIAGRPYTSVDGLSGAGISAKEIAKIKDLVDVGTPSAATPRGGDSGGEEHARRCRRVGRSSRQRQGRSQYRKR